MTDGDAAAIEYRNVTKRFGDITAVDDVSFEVKQGELLALLGPSGSGKTTTLRMLAGFETPTEGRITLAGRDVTTVPTHKRDTGMVFQDYALFPHMTVGENIAFGLKRKGHSGDEIDQRIDEVLEMVDLAGFRDRSPPELSGGQQQRVATARAIAIEPAVLLMDEPLGALDKKLRDQLEVELVELQNELGITTLYVTHNQEEALTMADRVAVMNEGRIEQIATPTEIYEEPATEFVADFIGDTNFLDGELSRTEAGLNLRLNGSDIAVTDRGGDPANQVVFVRPEKIDLLSPGNSPSRDNAVSGTVNRVLFIGSKLRYYVDVHGQEIVAETENKHSTHRFEEGDDVVLTWDRGDTRVANA
jgi:spermidine/putrescine ABC transporter ATP-binding subunit